MTATNMRSNFGTFRCSPSLCTLVTWDGVSYPVRLQCRKSVFKELTNVGWDSHATHMLTHIHTYMSLLTCACCTCYKVSCILSCSYWQTPPIYLTLPLILTTYPPNHLQLSPSIHFCFLHLPTPSLPLLLPCYPLLTL